MLIKIQEFKRQSTYALEYHVTSGYLHAGTYTEYSSGQKKCLFSSHKIPHSTLKEKKREQRKWKFIFAFYIENTDYFPNISCTMKKNHIILVGNFRNSV